MSDVTIIPRKNYKSDFALKLTPKEVSGQSVTELPEGDFSLIFRSGGKSYTCSRKDGTYTNCVLNEDGTLTCVFDNHGLMPGVLSVECSFETANELYADGSQKEVSWVRPAGVELVTGNGDEATSFDIDLVMPFAIVTAYQMAVKYGYEGTEEDFYKALAGGSSLELGETAGTAYEGSKGKANADAIAAVKVDLATVQSTANAAKTTAEAASTEISSHEENTTNPHKVTAAQVGAYTKTEADAAMSDKVSGLAKSADVTAALANKVDKVTGKGLSTNDYTTAEKTKLAGIAEGATKNAVANFTIDANSANLEEYNKVIAQGLTGCVANLYGSDGSFYGSGQFFVNSTSTNSLEEEVAVQNEDADIADTEVATQSDEIDEAAKEAVADKVETNTGIGPNQSKIKELIAKALANKPATMADDTERTSIGSMLLNCLPYGNSGTIWEFFILCNDGLIEFNGETIVEGVLTQGEGENSITLPGYTSNATNYYAINLAIPSYGYDMQHVEYNPLASGYGAIALGGGSVASGKFSIAHGVPSTNASNHQNTASGLCSYALGCATIASGDFAHTEGDATTASGRSSHAEGDATTASGMGSHAEGLHTVASGAYSHAEGVYNVPSTLSIHSVGVGFFRNKNAEDTYFNQSNSTDTKNGHKYLIGIGGYDGTNFEKDGALNPDIKSVQEVITEMEDKVSELESSAGSGSSASSSKVVLDVYEDSNNLTAVNAFVTSEGYSAGGKCWLFNVDLCDEESFIGAGIGIYHKSEAFDVQLYVYYDGVAKYYKMSMSTGKITYVGKLTYA